MKKFLVMLTALVLVTGLGLAATYTNELGIVFTTGGTEGTTVTPVAPTYGTTTSAAIGPLVIRIDTNANPVITSYVPQRYGDIVLGTTSNCMWVSTGLTTNDWKQVLFE